MFARLLLLFVPLLPLCAQQDEVSRYLEERRAQVADPHGYKEAQRNRIKALTAQADHSDTEERARLYLQIGRMDQLIGDSDAAAEALRRAHELRPFDREISLTFAEALLQSGQLGQADGLLGVDTNDGAALIHRAQELVTGYPKAAARCANLARQLLPADASIADDLGMILMWAGENGSASAAFVQAVAQAPLVSTYHYHLALSSLQNRRDDDAKTELLAALELNPWEGERAAIRSALARLEPHR